MLEKILESPCTARKSNQSILKEVNPEYSLEGLMLKLKLQYFGHLIRRTDSLEKTLMLGKAEGRRRRGRQRIRKRKSTAVFYSKANDQHPGEIAMITLTKIRLMEKAGKHTMLPFKSSSR